MKGRPFLLALADATASQPLPSRIARAVTDAIRAGRLPPGAALPGSRELARNLGVHRNTVLAAYAALSQEGWITMQPARGTFVSTELPEVKPRAFARLAAATTPRSTGPGFGVPPLPFRLFEPYPTPSSRPGRAPLSLVGGVQDRRLLPVVALARAYRRALRREGAALLDYGDEAGHPRLRAALAELLARTRGLPLAPAEVLVTRGSQMAIDVAARALLRPGDVVAVEAFGYMPAWQALRATGAELVPVPVDEGGLVVDALADLLRRRPVRAVYVTPHHQYPTTVALAAPRRLALLALARTHRLVVFEDDYDHELHFDGRPLLPLASADTHRNVVYLGSLSKVLAPGLRIGYIVAPEPVVEVLRSVRRAADRQGDLAVEAAVAELLEDGDAERHVRRLRRAVHSRRDALVAALETHLGDAVGYTVPAGGMTLWAKVARGLDVEAWAEAAFDEGLVIPTARRFTFDGSVKPFFRFGFAHRNEDELAEAVRRLAAALPRALRKAKARRSMHGR